MSYYPVPKVGLSPRKMRESVEDVTHPSVPHHPSEYVEVNLKEPSCIQSDAPPLLQLVEKSSNTTQHLQGLEQGWHGKVRSIMRKIWLTVFLPVVAFAYLAFCYVTATQLVPVHVWMINEPMEHLYAIKAGVTTVNIIIVTIALLPLKALIDDIRSEEFFRALYRSPLGVPLRDINSISIPSNTFIRSVQAILHNRTSKYYTGAILSGIVGAIVSSLAPAALSVGLVLTDGEVMALEVGAVGDESVYRLGASRLVTQSNEAFQNAAGKAATMGWVQNVLGAEIAFTPTSSKYGVPAPLGINSTTRARYLTDVAVMDPICNWTTPRSPPRVSSDSDALFPEITLDLSHFDLLIKSLKSDFQNYFAYPKVLYVTGDRFSIGLDSLLNSTTLDPVSDGTMAWIIGRCTICNASDSDSDKSVFDLSDIPTQEYSFGVNVTNSTTEARKAEYSVLVCNPRLAIETREVVLDGSGELEVLNNTGLSSQGNLHPFQTMMLLGNGLVKYTSDSGPESGFSSIGRAGQVKMFFGSNLGNSTQSPVLRPQPIEKITEEFGLAQQAALCSYLSGALATAYVPGRLQVPKLAFTSSLPHIIVSTILFSLAALFINLCYLRSNMEQFTLFSVAAALARSNVAAVCEDTKVTGRTPKGAAREENVIGLVDDRLIYLANNDGSGPSLHME